MEPEEGVGGENLGNLARHPMVGHDHALGDRLVYGEVLLGSDAVEALLLELELHLGGLEVEGALRLPTGVPARRHLCAHTQMLAIFDPSPNSPN